jgi:AcrB/AcrD/AcrF family
LSNVATFKRDSVPTNLNQTNIQPVYDIYASAQRRDLGGIADDIGKVVAELQKELKPGNRIQILGQIQNMRDSFRDLGIGLLFAAVFVYLLMVVNYQNFADPFVVILALPATLCGIVTMLFITGTTLNVPSLTGAIMAVGVASANSILLPVLFTLPRRKGPATGTPAVPSRWLGFPLAASVGGFWSRRGIHPRVDARLRQSFAAHVSEKILIAIPIDVARISPLSCSGASVSPATCRFNSRIICFMRPVFLALAVGLPQ